MIKKFSYNQAIEEIQQIVDKIETEELDIDELSTNVKRITALIKQCRDKLQETEAEIEKLMKDIEK